MSFKHTDMINLSNYEEYFILYMDNELDAEQKLMVEAFVAQHPQLAEELDILMSTRLPMDNVSFTGKADLLSASMKVNTVDESLLLYIDNELPANERRAVEQQIDSNKDYALQHSLLMQTKADATEKVSYPDKKELYRHTERVVLFKPWMRIAAAVVVLVFGSVFFLVNKEEGPVAPVTATTTPAKQIPVVKENPSPVQQLIEKSGPATEPVVAQSTQATPREIEQAALPKVEEPIKNEVIAQEDVAVAPQERKVIEFDVKRLTTTPDVNDVAIKETLAHNPVTSYTPERKTDEDPTEPAVTDGDFKNTKKRSAKGLFRKVSRFIERNTGIGTANTDDELLIGAVSIKLK